MQMDASLWRTCQREHQVISVALACVGCRGRQGHKQPQNWGFPPQMERRLRREEGAPVTLPGVLVLYTANGAPWSCAGRGQ